MLIQVAELGPHVTLRALDRTPFLTDQSNHILDAALDEIPRPTEIAATIAAIPGVVEHGLFLNEIDTIVITRGDTVEVRHRGKLEVPLIYTCAAWMAALSRGDPRARPTEIPERRGLPYSRQVSIRSAALMSRTRLFGALNQSKPFKPF